MFTSSWILALIQPLKYSSGLSLPQSKLANSAWPDGTHNSASDMDMDVDVDVDTDMDMNMDTRGRVHGPRRTRACGVEAK